MTQTNVDGAEEETLRDVPQFYNGAESTEQAYAVGVGIQVDPALTEELYAIAVSQ